MLKQNPETVRLAYKSLPLQRHTFAQPAAEAALAAGEQGLFWEFHDRLFKDQAKINDKTIRQIALDLKLDMAAFDKYLEGAKARGLIARDIREAQAAGVRGTPTIFVNGILLRNRSLEGFQALIDEELKRLKEKGGG